VFRCESLVELRGPPCSVESRACSGVSHLLSLSDPSVQWTVDLVPV